MFGLILVAVVKHFAQLDLIVQQPPQNFRAVVGITAGRVPHLRKDVSS